MKLNNAEEREKDFRKWLEKEVTGPATRSTYPLALNEKLPKKLNSIGDSKYNNFFECTDIEYLNELQKRLLNKGDLHKFNKETQSRLCSASLGKYIKFLTEEKEPIKTYKIENKKIITNFGNLTFPLKNILLKGVPGTGKSRAIEKIINNKLGLEKHRENVLRINIHSASSNADLMQGIGISSNEGQIEYKEKQGLILDIIQRATFAPKQPFVLILEEIQENSLNELIGDLIYLIEDDKRAKNIVANEEVYDYQTLVEKIISDEPSTSYVEIPYLVNDSTEYRKMIMPDNLYIFCTSNYRDDKKVIEDNLLRRFEVLELYPKASVVHTYCQAFFGALNESILNVLKDEIHPDRFLIGHSNWLKVNTKEEFYRAFLKVVVEFKDIREVEFEDFKKIIKDIKLPDKVAVLNLENYMKLIQDLQNKAGYDFLND